MGNYRNSFARHARWLDRTSRLTAALLTAALAGCAYHNNGPIDAHYQRYKAGMPDGDKVFVCSSYGCRTQTPFRFTDADIAEVKTMMSDKRTATPADEREAIKAALAWMGNAGRRLPSAPPAIGRRRFRR